MVSNCSLHRAERCVGRNDRGKLGELVVDILIFPAEVRNFERSVQHVAPILVHYLILLDVWLTFESSFA